MAFDKRLRYDGVETYLEAQLDAGSNVIYFKGPLIMDGRVPVPVIQGDSNEYLVLTILDSNYVLEEIVYLYDYAGGSTGYVARGQEGTDPSTTHPVGNKVVHAATALDFISVQDHNEDETAHYDEMLAIAQAQAANAVQAHVEAANPHDQYALKDSPTFENDVTIPSGSTLIIESGAKIVVQEGATLTINGDLIVEGTGRFFINGSEIKVGNVEPSSISANMVWIQTFGEA